MNSKNDNNDSLIFKNLADRLKTIRSELGLSQADLAELFKVSQTQISRLESGLGSSPENLIKILQYYNSKGYNLEWIISEDNSSVLKKKDLVFSFDFDKDKIKDKVETIIQAGKELENIIAKI